MFFLFPVVSGRSSSCSFFLFFFVFFITEHVYLTQASNGHLGPSATPRTRPATRRKRPSNIKKKNEEQQQQHLEARPKKSNKKTQRWKQKKKNETGGTTKIKPKKKDKKERSLFFFIFSGFFCCCCWRPARRICTRNTQSESVPPKTGETNASAVCGGAKCERRREFVFFLKKKITSIPQQSKAKFAPVPHLRIMQMSHRHRYANELGEIGPFHWKKNTQKSK